jgi:H+/Cl- antiporter ClcA/predicted transcriptional regulator
MASEKINLFRYVQGKNEILECLDFEEQDGFDKYIHKTPFTLFAPVVHYFIAFLIAMATSALVLFSFFATSYLESWRRLIYERYLIRQQDIFTGYAFLMLFCMGFGIIGTVMVLFIQIAPGGGMPEVICYLNGIKIKHYTSMRTFTLKTLSMIMTNSSGLFTGYDGPLIHNGLILCHYIVNLFKNSPKLIFGERYDENVNEKGIISSKFHKFQIKMGLIYVATNIAAGFKSPVGGLMFALEEAMTYFEPALILLSLFACTATYLITNLLMRFSENGMILDYRSYAFLASDYICSHTPDYVDMLSYAFMGVVFGVLGALYTKSVIFFLRVSGKYFARLPYYRIFQVLFTIFLTCSVTVFLPWFAGDPCIPYANALTQIGAVSLCTYDCRVKGDFCLSRICLPDVVEDRYRLQNSDFFLQAPTMCATNSALFAPFPDANLTSILSVYQPPQRIVTDPINRCYYQFASLFLHTPDRVLMNLVSRGAYDLFDEKTLRSFVISYIFLSILAYDTLLPTDLSFPNLVIGAALGRLWGIYTNSIKEKYNMFPIDPGVYGIIGAAGFLSGTFRLCLTIVVVLTESTSELSYIVPLLIVSIISTIVGNWFGLGQFHEEINLNKFPFLRFSPPKDLTNQKVLDIMTPVNEIVSLSEKENIWTLFRKLNRTKFNGFPIVSSGKVIGLVQRYQLKAITRFIGSLSRLEQAAIFGENLRSAPSDDASFRGEEAVAILEKFERCAFKSKIKWDKDSQTVFIKDIMTKPVIVVPEAMGAKKAYGIFKHVGLRMLCVNNEKGILSGIVTREDLLTPHNK